MKCLFILLQVEWYRFTRSSAHPLLTCALFRLLRCPTGRNTATSHNIDSWFWLFLLSSNKLDVLVYCWLRFSDISYQGRALLYSMIIRFAVFTSGSGVLTVPSIVSYNATVVTSDWSTTLAKTSSSAKAFSSCEASSSASVSLIRLWSYCWTLCVCLDSVHIMCSF